MAKKRSNKPTPYERLGARIQQQIAAANQRGTNEVELRPIEGERDEDWDRLIDEISTNDEVSIERLEDGWRVTWEAVEDA